MEERELKKLGNNKYLLVVVNKEAKLKTEKEYDKEELKSIFRSMKAMKENLILQRNQLESQLSKFDVEETPAIIEFKEKLEAAKKLSEKEKLEKQLEQVNADVKLHGEQIIEIKKAIPELGRGKK